MKCNKWNLATLIIVIVCVIWSFRQTGHIFLTQTNKTPSNSTLIPSTAEIIAKSNLFETQIKNEIIVQLPSQKKKVQPFEYDTINPLESRKVSKTIELARDLQILEQKWTRYRDQNYPLILTYAEMSEISNIRISYSLTVDQLTSALESAYSGSDSDRILQIMNDLRNWYDSAIMNVVGLYRFQYMGQMRDEFNNASRGHFSTGVEVASFW